MATASPNSSTQSQPGISTDPLMMGVAFALILTVAQRLVGFLRNILFCRYLTDEQLGQWSMIYSVVLLLAPLAVLGLPGSFGRFVEHYQRRGQLRTFLKRTNTICLATTCAMAAILFAFPTKLSWIIFRDPDQVELIRAVGFALICVTCINYITSLLEALRQVRIVTLMRFTASILFAILSLTLLGLWQEGTTAVTVGFGVGTCLACLPAIWFLRKNRDGITSDGEPLTHSAMWRRIAPYAMWMWTSNLIHNMIEVADRYMLIHWAQGTAEQAQSFVGQYHSGRVIPTVLVGVATMLAGVLMPYMTALWEQGEKHNAVKQVNRTIKLVALGFTMVGTGVLVLAPYLFDIVLQGRYDDGLAVLPLTFVYCTWFSLFIVAQNYLWVSEKGKFTACVLAIGLITNIVLNSIMIPYFGLYGAVYATASANGVILVLNLLLNWRFGARPDRGIWLVALSPMVLLLPVQMCLFAAAVILILCARSSLLITSEEREEIENLFQSCIGKLTNRR